MNYLNGTWDDQSKDLHKTGGTTRSVIALVSCNQAFSERLCRATEAEIDMVEILRFGTVDDLVETLPMWRERLRLIVLDEAAAARLDVNLAGWVHGQSGARVACAYSDTRKTAQLVAGPLYPAAISSFFSWNLNFDAWISVLKLCLSGHTYVTPELMGMATVPAPERPAERPIRLEPEAATAAAPETSAAPSSLDRLTQRETEVLQHVARGHQNKVIADKLGLSMNTVKLHIHHIITKLGVHNRTEAAMIYATAKE